AMQAVSPLVDLVAVLVIVASVIVAGRIGYLTWRGRRAAALRVATRWIACAGVYVAVSLSASAMRPERSIGLGEQWCFDDWCIAVDRVSRSGTATDPIYAL